MNSPSFEEMNKPGYIPSFQLFKTIGKFFYDIKLNKRKSKLVNTSIEEKKFFELFEIMNSGYELNKTQKQNATILLYHFFNTKSGSKAGWRLFEKAIKENIKIPDEFLLSPMIYKSHSFFWDCNRYLYNNEVDKDYPCKHPLVVELYEERLNQQDFKRKLFKEWFYLLKEVADDTAIYQKKKTDSFYLYPHKHYTKRIEFPMMQYGHYLFEGATEAEYKEVVKLLLSFPEISKNIDKEDRAYCKQNSCYCHARHLAHFIDDQNYQSMTMNFSKNTYRRPSAKLKPLTIKDTSLYTEKTISKNTALPEVANLLIEKIDVLHKDLKEELNRMSSNDQFNYFNLYDKVLPEVLKKFQAVNHHQAENIQSINGQTPVQILETSLKSIEEIYTKMIVNIQELKLSELSANQRYVKEIKNKMK